MKRILWRLVKLAAPFKGWMALATLLGFATVGSNVGLMATAAFIIAKAALHPSIADLQVAIVGVRFFGIARGVFRYLERLVSHSVTFRLLARLRVWFYQALEPLAPARLIQYRSGDLLSRVVADIETLEHFYGRVIAPPVVAGLGGATDVALDGGLRPDAGRGHVQLPGPGGGGRAPSHPMAEPGVGATDGDHSLGAERRSAGWRAGCG